ncbi:STAS domain-containing protein [Brucepastera parasyntrophica]|uniref:STAS domain-containing protein n=1 Tax=Brucepastera parasyntrophica TaxID=2880008 RepID=UPI0034E20C9E
MTGFSSIKSIMRGQKSDIIVLFATLIITVFVDLTVAIGAGLVLSVVFFLRKIIKLSSINKMQADAHEQAGFPAGAEGQIAPDVLDKILVYEIGGVLFFGTVRKLETITDLSDSPYKVLILRMQHTLYLDADGLHVLEEVYKNCKKRDITLLISEIHTQPYLLFFKSEIITKIGIDNVFGSFKEAYRRAVEILEKKE